MSSCPLGMVMLQIKCKKSGDLKLMIPLKSFIAVTMGDTAAEDAAEEIEMLQDLRTKVIDLSGSLVNWNIDSMTK